MPPSEQQVSALPPVHFAQPRGAVPTEEPESAADVFVEPVGRALPRQIGRGLVIPFRRRVAIEAMSRTRVNVAFVWNVRRA